MNVATISMPKDKARIEFLKYKAAVKSKPCASDRLIMESYRQLSLGKRVINARDAIVSAGVDQKNHPRLAFAQADAEFCWYRRDEFYWSETARWRVNSAKKFKLPASSFPHFSEYELKAIVPTIPPDLRPAGQLHRYHILWEADWQKVPVDPMLLKHIGGPLYAVLAVWDLTDVERAILGMRR